MNNSKDVLVNYYAAISNADLESISTCFDLPAKLISLYGAVDIINKKDIITTYDSIIKTWNEQGISKQIGYDVDKFKITRVQNNVDLIQTELKNYDLNGYYIQSWRSIYILRLVNTKWIISLATSDNKRSSSIKNGK
jgi:hypothetical protein